MQQKSCLLVPTTPSASSDIIFSSPSSSTPTSSLRSDTESDGDLNLPTILYPAPVPQFSASIKDVLRKGDKKQLLLIFSEMIAEAALFYLPLLPSDTARAKVFFENVGRSLVETSCAGCY
jgi:hypothetical protein